MSSNEEYVDALYSALRSRDVKLTWCELEDSLREAAEEYNAQRLPLDPQPWVSTTFDLERYISKDDYEGAHTVVFLPRPEYSQDREDYN